MKTTQDLEAGGGRPQKYEVSRKKAILLLVVLTLLYALAYMDRSVISVVMEGMKRDMGLSDGQMGMLHTIFMLGVGLLMLPCGFWVDRWSRRKAIGLMAIVWSAATFFTGMCSRFTLLLSARFLTSAGEAGFAPGGIAWLSLTFPKKARAKVLGIFSIGIPLGGAMGVGLGGLIASATGSWRTPFYVFAIPGIVLGIAAFFLPDYKAVDPESEEGGEKQGLRDILDLLKIRSLIFAALGQSAFVFLIFAMTGWLPTMFIRQYQLDAGKAGMFTGLIYIFSVFGSVIGGVIADRRQQRNPRGQYEFVIIAVLLSTVVFAFFFMFFSKSLVHAIVLGAAAFFLGSLGTPAFSFISQDVVEPKMRASSYALCGNLVFIAGAAWGPTIVGFLSDALGGGAEGVLTAFLYLTPMGLLGAALYLVGLRYYLADREGITDDVIREHLDEAST